MNPLNKYNVWCFKNKVPIVILTPNNGMTMTTMFFEGLTKH